MTRTDEDAPAGEADGGVRILARETLFEGFGAYHQMTVEHGRADGGRQTVSREYQTRADVVAVLPYDPVRRVAILARQLRVPLLARGDHDGYLVEAPAGHIDEGEDPAAAARREAAEEVGVTVGEMEHVGDVFASPGAMTERLGLYLAAYGAGDRVSGGGGLADEGEDIEVLECALAELAEAARGGDIADAKTLMLIQALQLRRPELFS
jgi:nudix-type nucleoside diphosphatase (YffH/AdpP family)